MGRDKSNLFFEVELWMSYRLLCTVTFVEAMLGNLLDIVGFVEGILDFSLDALRLLTTIVCG